MAKEKPKGLLDLLAGSSLIALSSNLSDSSSASMNEEQRDESSFEVSVSRVNANSNWHDTSDWSDERKAICPSCQGQLKKIPGAKTKCPTCLEFMYVRSDPRTKSRRVVSLSELEAIDDAWAVLGGTFEARQAAKAEREKSRKEMTDFLGYEPSEALLDLHEIKMQLDEDLTYRQMGLVRNSYLKRAQLEFKEGNFQAAAFCFLSVVLLDGNGCDNAIEVFEEDEDGNELRYADGTGFEKDEISYLPYCAKELYRCISKGELDEIELLNDFSSLELEEKFGCPIPMVKVWPKFVKNTDFKSSTKAMSLNQSNL